MTSAYTGHIPGPDEQAVLTATLGAALPHVRAEHGLSTRRFAERSAVARSTITRLEAGQRRPTARDLPGRSVRISYTSLGRAVRRDQRIPLCECGASPGVEGMSHLIQAIREQVPVQVERRRRGR